jgi:hypothetical protein
VIKIQRFVTKSCCGKTSVSFKLDRPVHKDFLPLFLSGGFTEDSKFTKLGIFYIENKDLIASGPFGSDKIQVRCKNKECQEKLNDFEKLLEQME